VPAHRLSSKPPSNAPLMTQIKAPALAPTADAEQPSVGSARIGVLIVYLGTPEANDFW
jgi:hypothetical protein